MKQVNVHFVRHHCHHFYAGRVLEVQADFDYPGLIIGKPKLDKLEYILIYVYL